MNIRIISLTLCLLAGGCSDDDSTGPTGSGSDDLPPAAIADLDTTLGTENQLLLRWTAPGDDGLTGTATSYDVRYAAGEDDFVWDQAEPVSGVHSPSISGSLETMELPESFEQGGWSLAIRTADEVPNWSELSNIVSLAPPPMRISATTPHDGVRLNTAGEDTVILDLGVTFSRAAAAEEVTLRMFPSAPRSGPVVRSDTGLNWSWRDVAMAEADSAYFWLVDGVEVLQPRVIRLVVSDIIGASGFAGSVLSSDPSQASVEGAVIFALDSDGGFDPLTPASFFNATSLAAATTDSTGSASETSYQLTHLRSDMSYVVMAIVDTSGDGRYDPSTDWWGYRGDGEGALEEIQAAVPLVGPYRNDVDIVLGPPSS